MLRYRFPEGNEIVYGQGYSYWQGIPSDRVFTEMPTLQPDAERVRLVAIGFGDGCDYGNGMIYVATKDLPEPLECCPNCGYLLDGGE